MTSRAPLTALYDADLPTDALAGRRLGIVGFGSQGRAHALNLRDGGLDVRVGLHEAAARARPRSRWASRCSRRARSPRRVRC
jgi:ketol-acid reductoisomerase